MFLLRAEFIVLFVRFLEYFRFASGKAQKTVYTEAHCRFNSFFESVWLFSCTYVCAPYVLLKECRSPGTAVTGRCELPCGGWELKRVLWKSSQCSEPVSLSWKSRKLEVGSQTVLPAPGGLLPLPH